MLKRKVEENRWCDRCGEKIDNEKFAAIDWRYETNHIQELLLRLELALNDKNNKIIDSEYIIKDDEEGCVRIRDGYFNYSKQFDLCPKCKRAFKKFMKWDGDEE